MDICLKDLLMANIFNNSRVLAGHAGLINEVKNANFLDAPVGCKYMKQGTLVITSGFCLNNEVAQIEVLENLAKNKVAGLALKLEFFNNELPEIMIEKANKLNFPIISIAQECIYQELLDFISNYVYSRKKEQFFHKEKAYEVFMNSANNEGIHGIIKKLYEFTGNHVFLTYENNLYQVPTKIINQDTLTNDLGKNFKISNLNLELSEYTVNISGKECHLLSTPLKNNEIIYGYLGLLEKNYNLSANDFYFLNLAKRAIIIEIQKNIFAQKEQKKYREEYIDKVLAKHFFNWEEAKRKGKELELNLPYQARVLVLDGQINPEVETTINSYLKQSFNKDIISLAYKNKIIMFIPFQNNTMLLPPAKILALLNSSYPKQTFYLGIGREATYENFYFSYKEAIHALEVRSLIDESLTIINFEDTGFYRLLLADTLPNEITKYYTDYFAALMVENNYLELIDTLKIYLSTNCNYTLTAKELFLHPNTVRYRIKHIENLCKVDLKKENDRLNICLVLKLLPFAINSKNQSP